MNDVLSEERVLFERGDYIVSVRKYWDGDMVYRLVDIEVGLALELYFREDVENGVRQVIVRIVDLDDYWNKISMSRFFEDVSKFEEVKNRASQITNPDDFMGLFLEMLSPSLGLLYEEIKRRISYLRRLANEIE